MFLRRLRRDFELERLASRVPVRRALSPYELDAVVLPFVRRVQPSMMLNELEDRRQFHPLGKFAMPAVVGGRSKVVMSNRVAANSMAASFLPERAFFGIETPYAPGWIGYKNIIPSVYTGVSRVAKRVVPCIRRKARREVMFANANDKAAAIERRRKFAAAASGRKFEPDERPVSPDVKSHRRKRNAWSDVNC